MNSRITRLVRVVLPLLASQATVAVLYSQATAAAQLALKPVDMKLLLLTASGTEPSFMAIQTFLNEIGIPHNDVILAAPGKAAVPLPPLNDATKGFYQGIILATGNLSECNAAGACTSALPDAGWTALDTYAATYGIRTLSYYTFPSPRYGLALVSPLSTTTATPGMVSVTTDGAAIFPYLNLTNPLKVVNSYAYLSMPVSATGETTTPILTMPGGTVGVLHKTADGKEYLALTLDNNPNLIHSLALSYGLLNWVTKGMFLGNRQIYFTPQVDDLFIANELYDATTPGCKPTGFLIDPTVDLSSGCPTAQVSAADLTGLVNWQNTIQANPQTARFKITMAFNGVGATDDNGNVDLTNPLASAAAANAGKFFWISHTFDHLNLDCYNPVPNSGVCTPANATQSATEIDSNVQVAQALGLHPDAVSMVTPEISGLNNANFIQTAFQRGLRYLIVDSSTLTANPPPPNTGLLDSVNNSILLVPRRPTSIFYNIDTPTTGVAGSLTDEYNYFYGPQGLFKIGGAGGTPFFSTNQTYDQIMDSESDSLLIDMLRFKADPIMFHQTNLVRYDGVNSVFTDLMSRTLKKFTDICNLPVMSLPQSSIGELYKVRMDYNAAGMLATWYPGTPASITINAAKTGALTVTGFCVNGCGTYGGQKTQVMRIAAGQPLTLIP